MKTLKEESELTERKMFNYRKYEGIVPSDLEPLPAFDFELSSSRSLIYSIFIANAIAKNAN